MVDTQLGPIFRELRVRKGYSMRAAANGEMTVQFLSQFERGQTGIGFGRLMQLLGNIHVSIDELATCESRGVNNWLDEWTAALDAAFQTGESGRLAQVHYPQYLRRAVQLVNELVLLTPRERQLKMTRREQFMVGNLLSKRFLFGTFLNVVTCFTAIGLPARVREQATARILAQACPGTERGVHSGTVFAALWGLAEAEIYAHRPQKARRLIDELAQRCPLQGIRERVALCALESELAYLRCEFHRARELRADIQQAGRILANADELNWYVRHISVVWRELRRT